MNNYFKPPTNFKCAGLTIEGLFDMYQSYMLDRTMEIFTYKNLPDTISKFEAESLLQTAGFGAAIEHDGKPYLLYANFAGRYNQNFLPIEVTISNAYITLPKNQYTINEDCIIIKNDSYCQGMLSLINKYAWLLANSEITLSLKDTMSRTPYILTAQSDTAKKSAEEFIKALMAGSIRIINDKKILDLSDISVIPSSDVSRSITDSIEYRQYLWACFLHEIGINSNYNMKRETLSRGETTLNDEGLKPLISNLLQCRQDGWARFNDKFGLNVEVELNDIWGEKFQLIGNVWKGGDYYARQ